MFTTTIKAVATASRFNELKTILESRRWELVHELQDKIRAVRTDGITDRDVLDAAESSEVDIQDDIGFALIQLKTETLNKIDTALRRLEEGSYGDCLECGEEIAEARLRALPFAVRCRDCEESREATDQRERSMAQRRGSPALFLDLRS
jgi:DnaK suppressor protein